VRHNAQPAMNRLRFLKLGIFRFVFLQQMDDFLFRVAQQQLEQVGKMMSPVWCMEITVGLVHIFPRIQNCIFRKFFERLIFRLAIGVQLEFIQSQRNRTVFFPVQPDFEFYPLKQFPYQGFVHEKSMGFRLFAGFDHNGRQALNTVNDA